MESWTNQNYRKDIDGLRAISIIFVIFNHLRLHCVPGGFLGVDIFFVISGYLITSHISQGIEKRDFSFKVFYLKRTKRILPALITVLLTTSFAAYFLFAPSDLKRFSGSLLAALGFYSNIYFWKTISVGYFSPNAMKMPLLHTWSLSIEEQFYIVWPLFLYFAYRHFCNRRVIFFTSAIAVSSMLCYFLLRGHPVFVFYFPFTRAYELLIGALLAMNYEKLRLPENRIIFHLLSLVGLGMILFSGLVLQKDDFPGVSIMIPCLGAFLLILTGKKQYSIANRLLSNSILVFVGLISYSLYLWHWPIISFAYYYGVSFNFQNDLLIIFISFLLSILTWRYIEQPFRFKLQYGSFKIRILLLMMLIPELTFSVLAHYNPQLGFNKTPDKLLKISNDYYGSLKEEYECMNSGNAKPLPSDSLCSIGNQHITKNNVLIVGDCHLFSYAGMLDQMLSNASLRGYVVTQSSDPFLLGKIRTRTNANEAGRNIAIAQLIQDHRFKYVVLSAWWKNYGANELSSADTNDKSNYAVLGWGLDNAIKLIESRSATPVIIFDFPPLYNVPKICGLSRISLKHCYNNLTFIEKKQLQTREIILNLKKKYKNIILIDPSKIICEQSRCVSSINGTPLYWSGGPDSHLNAEGSQLIGSLYLKKFGNPFISQGQH